MNCSLVSIVAIICIVVLQIVNSSVVEQPGVDYSGYGRIEQLKPYRYLKRAHHIDTRALNQFKNCYFSPIQCVLMERRRK